MTDIPWRPFDAANLQEYKVQYSKEGWTRRDAVIKDDIHFIRERHGYPFFSCKIALANENGDVNAAIAALKLAFGRE